MPKIKPEILIWARNTADLTPAEAATKLAILNTKASNPEDRLLEYEKTGEISRSLLVKMSKVYRRPLLVFYMSSPPRKGDRGQDFRTLPQDYSASENAYLDVLIRDVMARQSLIRSVLEDDEEIKPLSFIGSAKMSDGVISIIESLEQKLNINRNDFYAKPNPDEAFALLRRSTEGLGIFVLLIGDLGNHTTKIGPEIFRGFAAADSIAPFIVINDRDSHSAWSFTLLHELAHLWLGQTGVSNSFANTKIEQFCNDIAGGFLLPEEQLQSLDINTATPLEDAEQEITYFANDRNLSSTMVAYKLFRSGKIEEETWIRLRNAFYSFWLQSRDKKRESSKKGTGPDYYLVRKQRIGKALIQLVDHMMMEGSLSTSKAGTILGIKAKNVGNLIDVARIG